MIIIDCFYFTTDFLKLFNKSKKGCIKFLDQVSKIRILVDINVDNVVLE